VHYCNYNPAVNTVTSRKVRPRHYPFPNGSLLSWPHWCFVAFMALRQLISLSPSAESFHRAADDESRRRLRSGASPALLVPTTRRRTLGDRAFPVAGARVWNSLPATLTSQSSLLTFRQQLKTLLFERSSVTNCFSLLLDTTYLARFCFF